MHYVETLEHYGNISQCKCQLMLALIFINKVLVQVFLHKYFKTSFKQQLSIHISIINNKEHEKWQARNLHGM